MNHRRRESLASMPDQRFQQGTTTGNAYKQPEPEVFKRKVLLLTQVLFMKTLGKIHAFFLLLFTIIFSMSIYETAVLSYKKP